ncbi:ribonuclease P protein subunit p21-like isoform X1 [Tachypleus tridentatus]|uniref:ribonuclease P protein subunit p21-like isoform X1 n=2 Tax=Tachypleus tridentatus TaxID=6853 RepID=UPI003FD25686
MGKGRDIDVFHRMNFLYQVMHKTIAKFPENLGLLYYYGFTLQMISQRTTSKLDHNIKSFICKRCNILLYPGLTSTVRLKTKRSKHRVVTCMVCGRRKRFLCRRDYQVWYDKPPA